MSEGRKKGKSNRTRAAEPVQNAAPRRQRGPPRPKSELQSGLPINWPNSSADELAARPVRHIDIGYPQSYAYPNNFVRSARFNIINFLPLFMLDFFNPNLKIANVYFIVIAAIQCIPQISITRGIPTTLIPLTVLLIIDSAFMALEDLKRHEADKIANSSYVSRLDYETSQFESCYWKDVEVGDFIQVQARNIIPADLIIISVAEKGAIPTGKCFVETKSLDGETSLKSRQALPATFHHVSTVRALESVKGTVSMEHPNRSIHSFQGIVELESGAGAGGSSSATCEVTKDNVILRGSVLRNSDWIIGLVVNTGADTKIFMSMSKPALKRSNLEEKMQKEIIKVIGLLLAMCALGSFGHSVWEISRDVGSHWYLSYTPNPSKNFVLYFMHYLLVNAPIIPVSLYVSIVFVRYAQSYFMRNDLEMYHEATESTMDVKNMNLNEQLGQITHVVSDKTGTLTCNVMDFRKMSVHGVSYGQGISSIAKANWEILGKEIPSETLLGEEKAQQNAVKHVAFYCSRYEKDMAILGPQRARIQNFFRVLAICHDSEIEVDHSMPDSIRLSTSNPDDEALICAADYFGYKFIERTGGTLKLENRYSKQADNIEELDILHTFEFTSERRRMSVVVKEPSGKIVLYMKGAKGVISGRLSQGNLKETIKLTELDYKSYTEEGLRCLYVACVTINTEKYNEWVQQYSEARLDLRQINRQKSGEANLVDDLINDLEKDLTLLGCTAIEDRLQFGVSECVEELLAAGINIWMLTGDTQDTGVNSGLAAKLLLPEKHSHHVIFDRKEFKTKLEMRNAFKMHINNFDYSLEEDGLTAMKPWFLIVDGATLAIAMDDKSVDGMRYLLSELSMRCRSVVGCRVSPAQKRELTVFLAEQEDTTVLAVGDGANDMPMIRSANVGVGLIGQEGRQAASVADYSISQFRYLSPLIIKHGQCNYIRMANLVCFIFYKNFLLSLSMYWYNFSCGFTGQNFIVEGAIQMYNLFYTSLPILYYASYDMPVSRNTFYRFPQMYRICVSGFYFTTKTLWSWMMTAVFESVVASIMPLFLLQGLDIKTGNLTTMWEAGGVTMTIIVFCTNTKFFFIQNKFHWSHYLIAFIGPFSWVLSMFVISGVIEFDYNAHGIFSHTLQSPYFWIASLLCLLVIIGRDIYSCSVERHFNFQPQHIIQEADAAQRLRVLKNMQKGVVQDASNIPTGNMEEENVVDISQGQPQINGAVIDDNKGDYNNIPTKNDEINEVEMGFGSRVVVPGQIAHETSDADGASDSDK